MLRDTPTRQEYIRKKAGFLTIEIPTEDHAWTNENQSPKKQRIILLKYHDELDWSLVKIMMITLFIGASCNLYQLYFHLPEQSKR